MTTPDLAITVDGPPDAPPVVMLHSLGSDSSMWDPQAEALSAGWRVVRIDTRGHGGSSAPPGPYALADLAGDVLGVADGLGLDTFHVCGLSMGGQTALWLAIHHGPRLRSLTAANTAALVGSPDGWQSRIDAVAEQGLTGIRDDVLTRFFAPGFEEVQPEAFAQAQAAFTQADDKGYIACCAALQGADLREDIADITVPTLVIGAEHDVSTPLEQARWLHEHIAGSELVVLFDAAHLSNRDRPAAFTGALTRHLTRAENDR